MDIEKNDSAAVLTYDRERLAELSKLAIGGRTLREFANVSGLSEGFLSRLTTGKLLSAPTRRSIAKLMAESSRPQNGITLEEMMRAAGYSITSYIISKVAGPVSNDEEALPAEAQSSAFPVFLTASVLERTGQLGHRYSSDHQREMFVISVKGGKDIIGIPAFCGLGAVEDEMKEAKRNLLVAYSIYSEEIRDKFLVVLTNQPELYENFDRTRMFGYGGEFYLALTEDFRSFTQQRPGPDHQPGRRTGDWRRGARDL